METEDGRRFAESRVKQLTGGDRITTRRMREDFWSFEPTHKLWIAGNHKPTVRGTDHGFWRRLLPVPFEVVVPPERQDKDLFFKLRAELPGILAWAVRGSLDWQRHGLGVPNEVRQAAADYRSEQDILGAFLAESCITGPDYRVRSSELFSAYTAWCKAGNEFAVTQTKFGRTLTERGFERYTSDGSWWRGIAVATQPTEPTEGLGPFSG